MSATWKISKASDFAVSPPEGYTVPYISTKGCLMRTLPGGGVKQMTVPLLLNISDSADLNDYILLGSYRCWTNLKARTLKNLPFLLTGTAQDKNVAFYMLVHRTTGAAAVQLLFPYNNTTLVWRRRRAEDTYAWSQWVVYKALLPTLLHVGPTRAIKTIALLNVYLSNANTAGLCCIIFDAGTYEGTLTINGPGQFEIRGSQYGTEDRDATVLLQLIVRTCSYVGVFNISTSQRLGIARNQAVVLSYVDAITAISMSLDTNVLVLATSCRFLTTATGDCVSAQGTAFMSFTDCYFKGSGTGALIALTNSHVDIYGLTTFSDAHYCIYITYGSTVRCDSANSTTITINNISTTLLNASTGSTIQMLPTSTTTRTGTQAATISSPAKNTAGNCNSFITYNTAYHT